MKIKNYIIIFKDGRVHVYSLKDDAEFLDLSKEFEMEVAFKVEEESEKAMERTKQVIMSCQNFLGGHMGREVLVGLFKEFVFHETKKSRFSWLNILERFKGKKLEIKIRYF